LRRKNFSSIDISEMPDLHQAVRKAQHFADLAANASTDQQREHYLEDRLSPEVLPRREAPAEHPEKVSVIPLSR
jgi:hypothetical protein